MLGRWGWCTAIILVAGLGTSSLARADISLFSSYYDNIARAAGKDDAAKVQQLVTSGNKLNEFDDDGRTGLQVAAINGNMQIAAILIRAGANLNIRDKLGNAALHYAADRNHAEMVELLLDSGAAVDQENRNGMTPLMLAASRGNVQEVQNLLAKGADPRKADYTGRDALGWAQESHRPSVVQTLQRAQARR
ncbi:MAG: ankyrin repeat domain-containing protein [Alphaproteobacteria bacterium]|nr:ankyrin repeat domain-containing protein [Alphaproteobacteria bacterium]